jgi:hypothetical protein
MKRRLARSPQARIMAEQPFILARTSTSRGVISSASTIGCFSIIARKPDCGKPFSKERCRYFLAALAGVVE